MNRLSSGLRLLVVVAVAALLGTVACNVEEKETSSKPAVKDVATRHIAPDFALKDSTGKVVHLSDYKGKVVMLDFWATWCGPCKMEIPWFTEFERKYKVRGFEVVGISMDDDGWKAIQPFATNEGINYRILLGDDKTGDLYGGIEALPTTFVIDREGRVASVHVGLHGRDEFKNAIESLL